MPNIKLMETALPIAPLKIAALDSCKELGQRVDQYIVRFRQDTLRESLDSPLFSSYRLDSYLVESQCPRFGTQQAKRLFHESLRAKHLC